MTFEYPEKYVAKEDWDQYLIENVPALAKLWSKGKHDAYETWKVLNGLTYQEYTSTLFGASEFLTSIAAVQPMSAPTGKIFKLNSRY